MPSKRTAKWLDAQNYLYELNQRWLDANKECDTHYHENGKDAKYYMLLGNQNGLKTAMEMCERFINGEYEVKY